VRNSIKVGDSSLRSEWQKRLSFF